MAKKKKAPTEEKPSSVPASQAKDAAEAAPPAGAPPSPPRTVDITKMKENKNMPNNGCYSKGHRMMIPSFNLVLILICMLTGMMV